MNRGNRIAIEMYSLLVASGLAIGRECECEYTNVQPFIIVVRMFEAQARHTCSFVSLSLDY